MTQTLLGTSSVVFDTLEDTKSSGGSSKLLVSFTVCTCLGKDEEVSVDEALGRTGSSVRSDPPFLCSFSEILFDLRLLSMLSGAGLSDTVFALFGIDLTAFVVGSPEWFFVRDLKIRTDRLLGPCPVVWSLSAAASQVPRYRGSCSSVKTASAPTAASASSVT